MARPRGFLAIRTGLAVVVLFAALARGAGAQDAAHDTQLWVQYVGVIPAGESWLVHTEVQPRWNEDVSRTDQVILRGAVGRRLGPRASIWVGHAYTPKQVGDEWQHEQRLWQQLSATFPRTGKWTPSIRIRPEQRFLEQWGDVSYRLRLMGRLVRPIGTSRWSVVGWNEYMVNFDDTVGGPQRGFDQNRVFAGAVRTLTGEVSLEAGYLWQLLPQTASQPRRHNHTIFAWLNWTPR